METTLPQEVIDEERRLVAAVERSSLELHRHRWHWTFDEANPCRVSVKAYAQAVGRDYQAIYTSANGYALYVEANAAGEGNLSIGDACVLARSARGRHEALLAESRRTGLSVSTVYQNDIRERKAERVAKAKPRESTTTSPKSVTNLDDVRRAPLDQAVHELDQAIVKLRQTVKPGPVARAAAPLLRLHIDRLTLIAELAEATAGSEDDKAAALKDDGSS